jgi:hypothetical protein
MMQRGQLAGSVRGQEFGEKSAQAQAADSMKQFNASTQVGVDSRNMDTRQGVNQQNTGIANQQQVHNSYTLPQQQFQDATSKINTVSSVRAPHATYEQDKIEQKQAGRERSAGALGEAVQVGATLFKSDEKVKKDVKPTKEVDIQEFLDSFSPKNFKYKNEEFGKGEYTGFMAQDVKDTKLGKDLISEDESGLLKYDSQKLQGIQLAAIKFLADKIKDIKK